MIELQNYTIPQLARLRFIHSIKTWGRKRKKVCKDCDITPKEYNEYLDELNLRGRRYGGDKSD